MDRFLQEAGTLYFWIVGVLVAIAVNLISTLIAKFVPRFGLSLRFWWRIRAKKLTDNDSQKEKEFRAKVSAVASQPALISAFLVRAYALYFCGIALCLVGVAYLFLNLSGDGVLLYGPKYSWSWWLATVGAFVKAIFLLTFGVQVLKLANERYLISTIAEEQLINSGLDSLSVKASPAPLSEL